MSWKNGYYYRNKRVGVRVVSEYIGAGYLAGLAAEHDELLRAKAAVDREQFRAVVEAENAIDNQIDDIGEQLQQWVSAVLLVSGHHRHKGQWRKIRGNTHG